MSRVYIKMDGSSTECDQLMDSSLANVDETYAKTLF